MAISEELELDISGALDAIESLNDSLSGLGDSLTVTLTGAIEAVDVTPLVEQLAALDASGLTTTIEAAVAEAGGTVPVEADTSAIPPEIDASIDSSDTTVVLDADASTVPAEIDAAIGEADTTVPLEADTADFGGSIDEALAAADTTIPIQADVVDIGSEIEAEVQSADTTVVIEADTAALEEISGATGDATTGLEGVTEASGDLQAAASGNLGAGALGGLTSTLAKAGPIGIAGAAGIGVFTAGVKTLFDLAVPALATQQRFNDTFGDLAKQASQVKLGGLNSDLQELAILLGSDDEELQDAASSLFQFGKASGFTNKQSLELVNTATALAARAVALNPALGSVGSAAAGITNAFARGGKFATKYNLALTATEINARALANTGKASAAELTVQEKAFAGSQIAAEKYAASIEKDVTKGSKSAIIEQRRLRVELENVGEEAGKPLVFPIQKLMRELIPIAKALAPIFADLAKDTIPLLAQSLKDMAPGIAVLAETFRSLTPILVPLQKLVNLMVNPLAQIAALKDGFELLGSALGPIGGLFGDIGSALGDIGGSVTDFVTDLGGAGDAIPDFSGILSFFTDLPGTITGALGEATSALTGFATEGTEALLGFFSELPGKIVAVLQGLPGLVANVFIQTLTDAAAAVIAGSLSVVAAIAILPGKIVEALRAATEFLVAAGTELIQGLINGVTAAVPAILSFFAQLPGQVVTAIGDTLTTLVQTGVNLIQGMIDGIQAAFPVVVQFFRDLPGAVVGFVGDVLGTLRQKGVDIIQGFIDGAFQAGFGVIRFFQQLPGAAIGAVGNVLRGANSLFQAGLDLIQGLIDGIVQKAKDIPGTIADKVIKIIPKQVRDFFKSDSPSKLMAGIGRDITAGLALGIVQEAGAVKDAVSQVSKEAITGVGSIPAVLPIPGISKLPAVAAALPSAAAAAPTAGSTSGGFFNDRTLGAVNIENLIIQTPAKDQTMVGIETAKQLRAESFRAGR